MADKVVVISYAESAKALETLSTLKSLDGDNDVRSAAIIAIGPDRVPAIKDGFDMESGTGSAIGGLIGMTIGILGGPLGMLFGLGTGGLIGAAGDAGEAADYSGVVARIVDELTPGQHAVIAHVIENDPTVLDKIALESGGALERASSADLLNDLYAAEDEAKAEAKAEKDAEKEVKKEEKAEKRAARKEKVHDKLEALKS